MGTESLKTTLAFFESLLHGGPWAVTGERERGAAIAAR
jgi:hypothetical protein